MATHLCQQAAEGRQGVAAAPRFWYWRNRDPSAFAYGAWSVNVLAVALTVPWSEVPELEWANPDPEPEWRRPPTPADVARILDVPGAFRTVPTTSVRYPVAPPDPGGVAIGPDPDLADICHCGRIPGCLTGEGCDPDDA